MNEFSMLKGAICFQNVHFVGLRDLGRVVNDRPLFFFGCPKAVSREAAQLQPGCFGLTRPSSNRPKPGHSTAQSIRPIANVCSARAKPPPDMPDSICTVLAASFATKLRIRGAWLRISSTQALVPTFQDALVIIPYTGFVASSRPGRPNKRPSHVKSSRSPCTCLCRTDVLEQRIPMMQTWAEFIKPCG